MVISERIFSDQISVIMTSIFPNTVLKDLLKKAVITQEILIWSPEKMHIGACIPQDDDGLFIPPFSVNTYQDPVVIPWSVNIGQ